MRNVNARSSRDAAHRRYPINSAFRTPHSALEEGGLG